MYQDLGKRNFIKILGGLTGAPIEERCWEKTHGLEAYEILDELEVHLRQGSMVIGEIKSTALASNPVSKSPALELQENSIEQGFLLLKI